MSLTLCRANILAAGLLAVLLAAPAAGQYRPADLGRGHGHSVWVSSPVAPSSSTAPAAWTLQAPPLMKRNRALAQVDLHLDDVLDKNVRAWTVSATFGPTRTQYFPTDIVVKTPDMDVRLKDVRLHERTSMKFYDPTHGDNPLQFIDEPTNTLTIRAEDRARRHAFILKYFHPKFVIVGEEGAGVVRAEGTLHGKPVAEVDLREAFGIWQLTYGLVQVQAGVEKIVPLAKGKAGRLDYAVGAGVAVYAGQSNVSVRNPTTGSLDEYKQKERLIGYGVSANHRLTYTTRRERVILSATHEVSTGALDYPMAGGRATQGLSYQSFNLGIGTTIGKVKRRRRP